MISCFKRQGEARITCYLNKTMISVKPPLKKQKKKTALKRFRLNVNTTVLFTFYWICTLHLIIKHHVYISLY